MNGKCGVEVMILKSHLVKTGEGITKNGHAGITNDLSYFDLYC